MITPHPLQGLVEPQFVEVTAIGKSDAFYRHSETLVGKKAMFVAQPFQIKDGLTREDNYFSGYLDISEFSSRELFSENEIQEGWIYFAQICVKPVQEESVATEVIFAFSNDRKDHMIVDACGQEHELIHKITWSDVTGGLILENFWVCQPQGKTFYVANDGMILEKNFRPVRSPYTEILRNPMIGIEEWVVTKRDDDDLTIDGNDKWGSLG